MSNPYTAPLFVHHRYWSKIEWGDNFFVSVYITVYQLENCLSRMTGKSKVVFKNAFLFKLATKQHTETKIIAYFS
jgi:hypothetical protein